MSASDPNIKIISQTLGVEGVSRVTQTEPEQDEVTGLWTRDLRVYTNPTGSNEQLFLTLRFTGISQTGIQFTTPALTY